MVKWIKIERTVYENLGNLANLLITLAVKVRADKIWDTKWCTKWYNDIPYDADTWKRYSSLHPVITENQFEAYSQKKIKEH